MPEALAGFVDLACPPATCSGGSAPARGSATRLLIGRADASGISPPELGTVSAPGRVHALGRFDSDRLRVRLADALPEQLRASLRAGFDWYACRGAFFHNDAHYEEVLFGAWCAGGPPRDIVFARAGCRLRLAAGDWVAFDPFEPHAVLDPGAERYRREDYAGAPPSVYIGFELALDDPVRSAFGIGAAPADAPLLSSHVAVNAETGSLA